MLPLSAPETPSLHAHRPRRNNTSDDLTDIETVVDEHLVDANVSTEPPPAAAPDAQLLTAGADMDSTSSSPSPAQESGGVSEDGKRQIGAAAILSLVGIMAAAAGSGLVGGGSSGQTAKPENDHKPDPGTGTKPDPDTGTKPDPDTGTKPDPDTGTKPDPDTGTKPDPDTGTKPDPDTGTKPDPDTGTKPDPDHTPPERPTVSLAADTGERGDDLLTHDATLHISGLEPGATWRFSMDGGKTWTAGVGDHIPADQFRTDGAQSVLVEQIDAAGNHSEAAKFDFVLDTRAPMLSASLLVDTGASAAADPGNETLSDRVTRVATVLVDGLESGRPWQFSLDGVTWREGSAQHQIDGSVFGADGDKIVHVRQTDAAGNTGQTELAFTLDRAIDPATIQVYDSNPFTGVYQPGSSTLTSVPRVHVNAEAGSYWTYEFDTGERGTGRGTASIDPLWRLPEGERTVTVRVEDGAGNVATSHLNFTLDRTSPGPLTLQLVHDTGASATDGITQDGTIAVSGLKPGDKWYYRVSSNDLGDVVRWTEGDPNTMTIPSSALGADGKKLIDVMPMDPAGNISQADMGSLWIELDRHADAPLLVLKHDTGGSAGDFITADSTVVIKAEAGATLYGWSDSPGMGGVNLNESLAAAQAPGEALVAGTGDKVLWVRQTDLAGNVSEFSVLSWTHTTAAVADGTHVTLNNRPDQGRTLLCGTAGADTFVWDPKTVNGAPRDVVTNYRAAEGDVLDLSRILTIEPGKSLADYISKTVYPLGEKIELFLHQPGEHEVDYGIALWNVATTEPIRIRTADGVFTI
ncbi:type I secretion C-terminal target domain-containing protein [Roseateles sp. So40a]|uniref:type I secretion C-terminal target domain-containing protein n=1 Tax=Roseateles sp. So40a TaxID=3400226 RepID=UPI003A892C09